MERQTDRQRETQREIERDRDRQRLRHRETESEREDLQSKECSVSLPWFGVISVSAAQCERAKSPQGLPLIYLFLLWVIATTLVHLPFCV